MGRSHSHRSVPLSAALKDFQGPKPTATRPEKIKVFQDRGGGGNKLTDYSQTRGFKCHEMIKNDPKLYFERPVRWYCPERKIVEKE